MSGIDEQHSDICPACHEIPFYWTLGNEQGGLIWLYTEKYYAVNTRNSVRFSAFVEAENMDAMESRIEYAWCNTCQNRCKDTSFVRKMFNRAKNLKKEGRVDIY